MTDWTDLRVATLREMHAQGASAAAIAAALGITRNAVIGKADRIGLSRPQPRKIRSASKPAGAKPAPASRLKPAPKPISEGDDAPEKQAAPPTKAEAWNALPTSKRVSIMELQPGVCRWPLGDPLQPGFSYCGADCSIIETYCPAHHSVAFTSARLLSPRAAKDAR